MYYANIKKDVTAIGLDDDFIYREIQLSLIKRQIPFEQIAREEVLEVFKARQEKIDEIEY